MNDKICGHILDKEQQEIVLDESKNLLVVAGAGSGKTLTIIGKIYYLIKYKNIRPEEILCISFTKASAQNLKEKIKVELNQDVPVYTFHKLSLEILKSNSRNYHIAQTDLLENIIINFFTVEILKSKKHMFLVLNYFNEFFTINVAKSYLKLLKTRNEEIMLFYKLIETFIRLFKCNNYNLDHFITLLKKAKHTINYWSYKKERILLTLILNIYLEYQSYLEENNEIDFDDMISKATKNIEQVGIKQAYKYVIIDEYQDTSRVRFLLVKSILDKTNANLMVVGDDFQSIYRFTGCDLDLFVDFSKYFEETKILKIQTTYRNSCELITAAGHFIMKNKRQIRKTLTSAKHLNQPIKIVYCKNIKKTLVKLINLIYTKTNKSILILGRNNKDIYMAIDNSFKIEGDKVIYLENKDINIRYLTVHRSKGLEEDSVIVINLENNVLGFPSKIKEEKLLRFVSVAKDKYLYSEERRLFYVALTRTKGYVYLLTQKNNSSVFIEELLRDYKENIEIIDYEG